MGDPGQLVDEHSREGDYDSIFKLSCKDRGRRGVYQFWRLRGPLNRGIAAKMSHTVRTAHTIAQTIEWPIAAAAALRAGSDTQGEEVQTGADAILGEGTHSHRGATVAPIGGGPAVPHRPTIRETSGGAGRLRHLRSASATMAIGRCITSLASFARRQ